MTARTATPRTDMARPRPSEAAARFLRREARAAARQFAVPRALNEECGVFGIIGAPDDDAGVKVALGLHALQHRGQEACGITTYDGERFYSDKKLGLVAHGFTDASTLDKLRGSAGIGHTRYSTTGGSEMRNVQPLYADLDRGGLAVAHNGNLTNAHTLRADLIRKGSIFHTTSDSELFVQLAALSRGMSMVDKVTDSLHSVEGAYALTVLTQDALLGVRDPKGIRPLVLGKLGDAPVLASESCAFDLIGAEFVRDVEPGEMVICRADGTVESRHIFAQRRARPCIFELIYFARPNSFIDGESVYDLRKRLGRKLAEESPSGADLVAPIPDSGVPAAIGYAQRSGLPYEMALIRSHYSGRTFIEPSQQIREAGVARKHSANTGVVAGKRVVLIDDSLVRGTTSRKITSMLREAGAREVHFRIACPPIVYPDFYGIDTPSQQELMAANHSIDEMCEMIGADSLAFLSLDGLYTALGKGPRSSQEPAFTDHCFTGDYPTALTDQDALSRSAKIEQLSLLRETS
ncbi:amidophosphoribosyltransferase [Parvularcula dongshanensis]|uniref:Amidophosphoribosyltransferase n=1 Tax=Parvularcula dongshanensis TaxID=1173995 RepID=A0A840I4Y4_9PROT|nr:amidophosphoribosyltransferase [Parvularcula dongshanensis]MBB4659847.1 amidophosphoribosyltransferase [Parvularcula dongshanensis]